MNFKQMIEKLRLRLTLDVFEFKHEFYIAVKCCRLRLTLDVFESGLNSGI